MIQDLHWYAVYTASRCEKKVKERLVEAGMESYLPVQTVVRQWTYRKKKVEVPVIAGFVFVRMRESERNAVLAMKGVVAFLKSRSDHHLIVIPDKQMEAFRFIIDFSEEMVEMVNEQVELGDAVCVVKGPLRGMVGELVNFNGKFKVGVRINGLGCALTIVPGSFVEKINNRE